MPSGLARRLQGFVRFGQRADLVRLHENRIAGLGPRRLGNTPCRSDEIIVADHLNAFADGTRERSHTGVITLSYWIFDGNNRITATQAMSRTTKSSEVSSIPSVAKR